MVTDRFVLKAIVGYAFPVPGKAGGDDAPMMPISMGTSARSMQEPWGTKWTAGCLLGRKRLRLCTASRQLRFLLVAIQLAAHSLRRLMMKATTCRRSWSVRSGFAMCEFSGIVGSVCK